MVTLRRQRHSNPDGFMQTLGKVSLDITVVLGTTSMPVHQVLRLGRGAIIELDTSEGDDVKILANDLPVGKGAVVVNGNKIAVEVTGLLPRSPELR
jgi:flagellar motor switch protein FliN/FliY